MYLPNYYVFVLVFELLSLVGGAETDKEGLCYEGHQEGSCIR